MSYRKFGAARRRAFNNPVFSNPNPPSYAGDLVTPFLTPALKSGDTLANNFVRQIDGITNKAVFQVSTIDNDIIQAAGCGFDDGDNVTLSEQVLTLVDLKVNEELCRANFLPSWVSQRGSRLRSDAASNEFRNFLLGITAAKVAEQVEQKIWRGTTGVVGFLSTDGTFDDDATGFAGSRLASATTQTITQMTYANVITQMGLVYEKAATDKPAILNKPDTRIFVSNKTAALYRHALATAGAAVSHDGSTTITGTGTGYNAQVTNQAFTGLNFLGIPIAECSGMFDDAIVVAQSENLVVGSNLLTDLTDVNYIPTYQYDGSDNVRIVMQFGLGVQVGIPADAVVGATTTALGS
jgi:hypothetical protein